MDSSHKNDNIHAQKGVFVAMGGNWTGWFTVAAIIVGFLFPAYLIDAIRLTDKEKAGEARGKACVSFGFLVIFLMLLINA